MKSPPRPASPEQAAWFSRLVMEGRRPRVVYRAEPINEHDSGWSFIEGSETDEWLNAPGAENCVMQHLSHAVASWPELAAVVSDPRPVSAWEWDAASASYGEVEPEL